MDNFIWWEGDKMTRCSLNFESGEVQKPSNYIWHGISNTPYSTGEYDEICGGSFGHHVTLIESIRWRGLSKSWAFQALYLLRLPVPRAMNPVVCWEWSFFSRICFETCHVSWLDTRRNHMLWLGIVQILRDGRLLTPSLCPKCCRVVGLLLPRCPVHHS